MMHECDQAMGCSDSERHLRQGAKRQAVDDQRSVVWLRCKHYVRRRSPLRAWLRKAITEVDCFHPPPQRAKLRDDAAIVGIAAGRDRQSTRYREADASHHSGPSCHARARCDSEMVTRMAFNARPSRPTSPLRAAAASASNTCLVRNSVVVFLPWNSEMSSRFL